MSTDLTAPSVQVSIVLTVLDGARYLRDSIDSCLGQTTKDLELIVVDGGSTDGSLDIVGSYDDPRIRLVHQTDNHGRLPGAINLGLDHARGEYLTWMQDDSVYDSSAIERMVTELNDHPEIGQVYCDYDEIDEMGRYIQTHRTIEADGILSARSDPLGVCFLLRDSVRRTVGKHDVATYPCQDFDYRIRIAKHFESRRIPESLYSWRRHADSLTGRLGWHRLARAGIGIRFNHGLLTRSGVKRERAEIDLAWAFEEYDRGNINAVLPLVLAAFWRHRAYAMNRGAWSVLVRSVIGAIVSGRITTRSGSENPHLRNVQD